MLNLFISNLGLGISEAVFRWRLKLYSLTNCVYLFDSLRILKSSRSVATGNFNLGFESIVYVGVRNYILLEIPDILNYSRITELILDFIILLFDSIFSN